MTTTRISTDRGVVNLRYMPRSEWGGGPVRSGFAVDPAQFVGLRVHHTVMVLKDFDGDGFRHGDLDDIAAYMLRLQTVRPDLGPEVPYSFVVFAGDGPLDVVVCEGRGRGRTGAHTAGHNSTSYGVAYAANTETEPVSVGMEEGVRWVGRAMLDDPAGARPTAGHWQSKATACQGRNGKAVQDRQQPPFTTGLVGEEPDMAQLDRIESKLDRLVAHWENPVAPAPLVKHSPAWFFRRWHHLFTKEGVVTKCDQQAEGDGDAAVLEVGKVADAVVDRLKQWLLR